MPHCNVGELLKIPTVPIPSKFDRKDGCHFRICSSTRSKVLRQRLLLRFKSAQGRKFFRIKKGEKMSKKILLAVDNSKNSLNAVKYVAQTINPNSQITMLSIIPDPTAACGLDGPSLIPLFKANVETFCTIEDAKMSAMEGFMQEAKKTFVKAGFSDKNIAIKVRKKKAGVARDILKEAQTGKYDTLVIGRRGLTGIKQFVSGSISHKIIENARDITVTVVE